MDGLHPTAAELAKANQKYKWAIARLAELKKARDDRRRAHRAAIATAINDPTATNVDLAALFGVTEGTIRNVRNTTRPERETTP